jgi:hypothetical protein
VKVEIVCTPSRYTERVRDYLQAQQPESAVCYHTLPASLPLMLDDPEELVPADLGQGDVVIAINVHPDLLVEIPHAVKGKNTRALIAPLEDPAWIRPGLQRQVTQACAEAGIESAFPKPFCSLEAGTPVLQEFSRLYRSGRPEMEITIEGGVVKAVDVKRGSPCGLTDFVAERLVGLEDDGTVPEKAGVLHHSYPCMASMAMDQETGDTIMHKSLDLLRNSVAEALEKAKAK